MHIPDGFLTVPVWAGLAAVSVPLVGVAARRAQGEAEENRIPLLGVMGAFVFGAQMVNFPLAPGTSGHLFGGALLACTLGPASAVVVMTAVLAIQALVFQDGGVLALGANVFNMALVGVVAGYLPYWLWGQGAGRDLAVATGGFLSVMASATLALTELRLSGVVIPPAALWLALGVFALNAVAEGLITLLVVRSLDRLHPGWIRRADAPRSAAVKTVLGASVALAVIGLAVASAAPDGLDRLAEELGISDRSRILWETPLSDYQARFLPPGWLQQAAAGLAGISLAGACVAAVAKLLSRRRSA
ncbi:MAG: energy-coupling factor ABC transporter permease [Bryobacterales bacterium]|nr:energy-coupling factor ABC transporter permease [Bryobacteraceae bacterium]MDW8355475.1 energy-coupling factor ABC transporter permease [Bryobacterales bacterium]